MAIFHQPFGSNTFAFEIAKLGVWTKDDISVTTNPSMMINTLSERHIHCAAARGKPGDKHLERPNFKLKRNRECLSSSPGQKQAN